MRPPAEASGLLFALAHGAGGSSSDPLLVELDGALARLGHGVARFDFGYRARGRKLPDPAAQLEAEWRAVIAHLRAHVPHGRLFIGGKSMGGRMATHLAAAGDRLDGLVLLGYPLHPAKQPQKLRVAHLPHVRAPALFLQGTRDALCELPRLLHALREMPAATLHVVEGGDHSLAVPKRAGRTRADVIEEIALVVDRWARSARPA